MGNVTVDLKGKTAVITGASRGIGRAIALRLASAGAAIAIAAKTSEPHPTLPGTINTVAEEIETLGGRALPLQLDVRDEQAVQAAVAKTVEHFGGIDILISNAGAAWQGRIGDVDDKVLRDSFELNFCDVPKCFSRNRAIAGENSLNLPTSFGGSRSLAFSCGIDFMQGNDAFVRA